ncbi:diguanylate cyclase domain-containing protein [Shewanella sp. NIFS-20-20]|uniref:GGDEF domain-containing protein n=1 Tax=Shewanella sp. NIFS-20-20 TaxID=2853806 RepID=UPI001C4502FD|nr:diguanylate cyclase [Shewanella sp. NIFS-20-20]MBV7315191.1 diguanylate cyclase [Shewanella sp. NIFS-20-20]
MIYSFRNASFRDSQTGVYNQEYFLEVFNREWHRHLREEQSLALVYLRPHVHEMVKHPKLLEIFSHEVEKSLLRATDLMAKFNQDIFALGLFNVNEQGAEVVIERIEHQIHKFLDTHGRDHSFSIDYKIATGVCTPDRRNSIEQLFNFVENLSDELEQASGPHVIALMPNN